jgi:hypothetical protein
MNRVKILVILALLVLTALFPLMVYAGYQLSGV